jgi:cytochrome c oxidase cbb3-type subunit 1
MLLTQKYDMKVVQWFSVMAVVYLVFGTSVGVWIASELAWPFLNFDIAEISFGRLRPLHTNAVIFAFGGSALMAAAFYIVQKTNQTKLWSTKMAWFTFWCWNLIIIGAVITLPLGLTQSKEYAELEWPLDILITLAWASYMYNFIMTIHIRNREKVPHVYVANWFLLGMMVMVTYLACC